MTLKSSAGTEPSSSSSSSGRFRSPYADSMRSPSSRTLDHARRPVQPVLHRDVPS
jgi:hypothetical protein